MEGVPEMPSERVVLKQISWRDICPWLVIFRTFGLAKSMPVLFLATVGALLTPVGWLAAEKLFVGDLSEYKASFLQTVQQNRLWPGAAGAMPTPEAGQYPTSVRQIVTVEPENIRAVFWRFVEPFNDLLDDSLTVNQSAYYAFGLLWMLIIWGFFGGAITRIAAVKLGREERISTGEAIRFAARKIGSYITSPLFPLVGVVLLAIPIGLLGLLMRLDWGVMVAGILWPMALLGGLFITILLVGLLFGWPLMWGTISSEREGDAFEAFSRSYSYTFQRPLHYLFYAFLATTFGAFGWLLVYYFSEAVVEFTHYAARMGAGADRWGDIRELIDSPAAGSGVIVWGALLLDLGTGLVRSVATGFGYSFFWCLATAIYLLLRRDVDQTEFDEVFIENEDTRYRLPDLSAQDAESTESGEANADASGPES